MFLFSSTIFSQERQDDEFLFTPQGLMNKVFDKEGNVFKFSEIVAGQTNHDKNGISINNTLLCTSGIFELYFETGSGMESTTDLNHAQRRAIICQAFQDVSDFVNTPLKNAGNTNKVKIWVRNPMNMPDPMPGNAAGAASAFYNLPTGTLPQGTTSVPNIGGIVDNEIWKTIHTGVDSYANSLFPLLYYSNLGGFYHGWVVFNFNGTVNWNLDYGKIDSATGYVPYSVDFYSTIIHEILHILGFNSLFNFNGSSQMQVTSEGSFGQYFTRYDKQLKTSSGSSLISNAVTTNGQMYNFTFTPPSNVLRPNCAFTPPIFNGNTGTYNCLTSLKYVGSITAPIYTPDCFERGSSLSHFEDACHNNNTNDQYFMMSDRASGVFAKRFITNEERQVLCDIGYSLKGVFGSASNFTYKNYGVTDCAGISVGGVNDGLLSTGGYSFQGNSGEDIIISGILNNDYIVGSTSNLRFEFVQDLYDPNAIFSFSSGNASTNFTFKSFVPGVHLLRYVPYDNVTGLRGNITYIYVNVLNNCLPINPCNLVRNGDFEEHIYPPNNHSQIYKSCGWQNVSYIPTADYFNSDSTAPVNTISGINPQSIPCNSKGIQSDKIVGNHGYIGMFIMPNKVNLLQNTFSESVKTELSNALLPNTQYQLSFDVSLAESFSKKSIKFQMLISDTNFELTTGGIIPAENITANSIFMTNPTFSNADSASENGWETITFIFTTGSNTNLKYLYLGGLNNVQFNNEVGIIYNNCDNNNSVGTHYTSDSYYYLDNVSLELVLQSGFLNAVSDNFSSMPINSISGGVTTSVYSNDLYNGNPSSMDNITNVTFSIIENSSISGATINELGLITIPPNTPVGTYILTYQIQTIGSCFVLDTATVVIYVSNFNLSPPLSSAIRANHMVNLVELQSNGKIIIAGRFDKYNSFTQHKISRLNSDLTLDQNFATSGPIPSNNSIVDMKIQLDNKIVLVGKFTGFGGGSNGVGLARLNTNGSLDSAFNLGGAGIGDNPGYTGKNSNAIAIQNDGRILIGGDFWFYNGVKRLGIVRLNPNGTIDYAFNPFELNNNYYRSVVMDIAVQPDGRILLSGIFDSKVAGMPAKHLIRLNQNGQIDNSFTMGDIVGSTYYNFLGSSVDTFLYSLKVLEDGRIVVVGGFDKYNGVNVNCIVRLNSNGLIDPSFTTSIGVDRAINSVLIEPSSEKIIIGGEFTTFNGNPVKKLIRLHTNGELDTSFSIGVGTYDPETSISTFYNSIQAIKKQPDGKVIVGGKFTMFNNIAAGNITRIYGDEGVQAKNESIDYQSEPEIDTNYENKVTVYPNPSNNIFTFDLTLDKSEFNSLTIYNLLGKNVYNSKVVSKENNLIDLSHLPKGCYIARLENDSQSVMIKLIKN